MSAPARLSPGCYLGLRRQAAVHSPLSLAAQLVQHPKARSVTVREINALALRIIQAERDEVMLAPRYAEVIGDVIAFEAWAYERLCLLAGAPAGHAMVEPVLCRWCGCSEFSPCVEANAHGHHSPCGWHPEIAATCTACAARYGLEPVRDHAPRSSTDIVRSIMMPWRTATSGMAVAR